MTKPRTPLNFAQAITIIAGRLGWAECARIVGRSERAVRYWSESDVATAPTLPQARDLDAAYRRAGGEGAPILESYARQLDAVLIETLADQAAIARDVAAVAIETADAIAAGIAVTQPGATATAIHHAIAETEEACGASTRLLGRLNSFLPRNRAGAEDTGGLR